MARTAEKHAVLITGKARAGKTTLAPIIQVALGADDTEVVALADPLKTMVQGVLYDVYDLDVRLADLHGEGGYNRNTHLCYTSKPRVLLVWAFWWCLAALASWVLYNIKDWLCILPPFVLIIFDRPEVEVFDSWCEVPYVFKGQPLTVRRALQEVGTGWCRQFLHDDVWVSTLLQNIDPAKHLIVPDVRMPNEATGLHTRLKAMGYVVHTVRITREAADIGDPAAAAHFSETAGAAIVTETTLANNGNLEDLTAAAFALVHQWLDTAGASIGSDHMND